jgi:hypothetical protein
MFGGAIVYYWVLKTGIQKKIFFIVNICIDFSIVIISLLLVLWFQWKISFGWADFLNNYPGWHWQSFYQYRLLAILCGLLGFQFTSSQTQLNQTEYKKDSLIALIILIQLFVSAFCAQWFHLYLSLAGIGMILVGYKVILLFHPNMDVISVESLENSSSNQFKPKFSIVFLGKPVMILLGGLGFGIMVVSHHWTASWVLYFCLVIGLSILFRFGINKSSLYSVQKGRLTLILIGLILISILIVYLYYNHLVPDLLLWSFLLTGFISFMKSGFEGSALSPKFNFLRPFQLIFGVIIFAIGVAGGIAFLFYVPLGEELGFKVIQYSLVFLWILFCLECVYFKVHNQQSSK